MLKSGRSVPTSEGSHQRGGGVALVLQGSAVDAWTSGGCQWKTWGLRLISAILDCGDRQSQLLLPDIGAICQANIMHGRPQ